MAGKKYKDYDFAGWATKNDQLCADGVVIRHGAFSGCDGERVPMYWEHDHGSPSSVLGHAYLEERSEGIYAYGYFNKSKAGRDAKEAVQHKDIDSLSILAHKVRKSGSDVIKGVIREISLCMAGANPVAKIESVLAHGLPLMDDEEEAVIYSGEYIIAHSESSSEEIHESEGPNEDEEETGEMQHSEDPKKEKTVQEAMDDLLKKASDDEKVALAMVMNAIAEQKDDEKKEEDGEMAHNIFESNTGTVKTAFLTKQQKEALVKDARQIGSMREAIIQHMESGDDDEIFALQHAINTAGMDVTEDHNTYGINGLSFLAPEAKAVTAQPEFISRDMGWVTRVLSEVHHTPFAKIKSIFADITDDEARAKGYMKGNLKKDEVFALLKRTTEGQMIYKKQKFDKDDIIDLSSVIDLAPFIRNEMGVMLNEEKARAILIGDGRLASSDDKIKEDRIRPIVTDAPLFNTVVKVTVSATATPDEIADAAIEAIIRASKKLKSTGKPTMWGASDYITDMLLLKNKIGERMYKTEAELATTLRVKDIVEVEPMDGLSITPYGESKAYPLIGIVTYLGDYNVGSDPLGKRTMYDDFDIDYNQQKYLLEEKFSGALIRPFTALTIVLDAGISTDATNSRTKSTE